MKEFFVGCNLTAKVLRIIKFYLKKTFKIYSKENLQKNFPLNCEYQLHWLIKTHSNSSIISTILRMHWDSFSIHFFYGIVSGWASFYSVYQFYDYMRLLYIHTHTRSEFYKLSESNCEEYCVQGERERNKKKKTIFLGKEIQNLFWPFSSLLIHKNLYKRSKKIITTTASKIFMNEFFFTTKFHSWKKRKSEKLD